MSDTKITRELIDNGKKIIHVNYTKKAKQRKQAAYDQLIMDVAEINRKRIEDEFKKQHPELSADFQDESRKESN